MEVITSGKCEKNRKWEEQPAAAWAAKDIAMFRPNSAPNGSSPRRLAANRQNSLKSTGPKSSAGKRRVALNALRGNLCPVELEKQLRARGQDPREFRALHRDLMAIFRPKQPATFAAVELLARLWWQKACRIRAWVGPGLPPTDRLDASLEEAMGVLVLTKQVRHEWWRTELSSVLGRRALPTPAAVRCAIEARLSLFGATKARRRYPARPSRAQLLEGLGALKKLAAIAARLNTQPKHTRPAAEHGVDASATSKPAYPAKEEAG